MAKIVPSLSGAGWLTGLTERADEIFANFMSSQYTQSTLYYGRVDSLSWILATYAGDTIRLRTELISRMTIMFEQHFDTATVLVTITTPDNDKPDTININMDITILHETKKYNFGRLLLANGKRFRLIQEANNGNA